MVDGMAAYNSHRREPAKFLKRKESLSDYQNRKEVGVKRNKSDHEILNELNKMFL